MYTMKIILFDILLLCAIAEIFAKWSSTNPDMTVSDTDTAQEEAVQDIMDLLNNKDNYEEDFVGLQDFPLEKMLENSVPPEAKNKKHKKKKKVINNLPVYSNPNIKHVQYQKGNKFKPVTETAIGKPYLGGQKVKFPIKYPTQNFPDETEFVPSQNMGVPDLGPLNDKTKVHFLPPTVNYVVKFEDLPSLLPDYFEQPPGVNPKKFVAPQKKKPPQIPHYEQAKQKYSKNRNIPNPKKSTNENYHEPVNKLIILDLPPNARLTKIFKGRLQEREPNEYSAPENYDQINNWQKGYNNLLKSLKNKIYDKKKLFRDGDQPDPDDDNNTPPDTGATPDLEENHDASFSEKLKEKSKYYFSKFKKLLQDIVAKFMNKTVEEKEKARQGHLRHLRAKRDTQGGYSNDPDTCQKYNENLLKMWTQLSSYLNATDDVNESALHNIAVMVEAYLDHHNKNGHEDEIKVTRQEKKKDKISDVLRKIKKILGTDDATDKVKEMVLENFKPEYEDDECKEINEDNLVSSIAISYKNYLDNAKCHGDYDTGLLRGKSSSLRAGPPEKTESSSSNFHDLDENIQRSILNEDESTEEFHRGKLPAVQRSKELEGSDREKRSIGRNYNNNSNKDVRSKSRSGMLRKRHPRKSSKKRNRGRKRHHVMRTDESCVKYANRKFLITLRTSIERFMDLRDCSHDDTLRTSNARKSPVDVQPEDVKTYVPIVRSPNERSFIQRKFYSDTEIGPREQNQLNNYLSQVKDFENQNPAKNEKPLYVVHSTAYKNPVLLKIQDKPDQRSDPVILHHPTKIIDHNYPIRNSKTKDNLDSVYKKFLESSGPHTKNTYVSKYGIELMQPKHKLRDASEDSLYELMKKKVTEHKNNRPIDEVARQNDDSNPFAESKINGTSDDNTGDGEFHFRHGSADGVSVNFNAMGDIINEVHNASLSNPQVDMLSIASESERGYVELSYLVKYPKSIIYRPQYLVKNILQYEDFVKVASQIYVTDDDRQLLKIVRYLPDNSTQTLFETQDFKSPLEIHDISDDKKGFLGADDDIATPETQLRQQPTNETEIYPDYDNETLSNVTAPESLREDINKEEDFSVSSDENGYKFTEGKDYSLFKSMPENVSETLNETAIERTKPEPDVELSEINLDTANSTETDIKPETEEDIDARIIEILNASLNSGEFVNHKDELDLSESDNTTSKDTNKISPETIADYLRFKLNGDANLSSASHAYLKELEAQGVSTTALTKSMLRTWWESWKNKLNTKVQSIAGRVSRILKKLEHPATSTLSAPSAKDEPENVTEATAEEDKVA